MSSAAVVIGALGLRRCFYCIGRDPRTINSIKTYCGLRSFRLVSSQVTSAGTERSMQMVQTLDRLFLKEKFDHGIHYFD